MPHHSGNSHAIQDHSITCHLAEVTFPALSLPVKAGTEFSNPGGMQDCVDLKLAWLHTEVVYSSEDSHPSSTNRAHRRVTLFCD